MIGKRGAVATSQPQSVLAGMEMFLHGGNAVDAALASAVSLCVLEPVSNGIGSDAFAIVWDGRPVGLNASGKSPAGLDVSLLEGATSFPELGWLPVTVPGAVSAWIALWRRYGSLSLEVIFAPAIRYAEEGFALTPHTALAWGRAASRFRVLAQDLQASFFASFFPDGFQPRPGALFRNPDQARTLREIAKTQGESFYRGALAQQMVLFSKKTGGFLSLEDLGNHKPLWVEPLSMDYRGVTVYELPPNGQGLASLLALGILSNLNLSRYPRESAESYHLQIEAMKLAFDETRSRIADPEMDLPDPRGLLVSEHLTQRASLIQGQARPLEGAIPLYPGGTVYLATADKELQVSFIQSNYQGFGSGVVIPRTGIAMQNRGACFTLMPGHPNAVAPGKRPYHTIIPSFLAKNGEPLGPFGVMGGPMQPQGHLQVIVNLVDYGMDPQTALETPRWKVLDGAHILLESTVPRSVALALQDKGHAVGMSADPAEFGKGQVILQEDQVFFAGTDPRADGLALAW